MLTSLWHLTLKAVAGAVEGEKVDKALFPGTAYFGDHVELTDNKNDFASQIGIGGVPGTKFVYPATGVAGKDENFLTRKRNPV